MRHAYAKIVHVTHTPWLTETRAEPSTATATATAIESEATEIALRLHATPSISLKTLCFDLIKVLTYYHFCCTHPVVGRKRGML